MTSTASPIKSLAAYDKIRDMILAGEALPGTRLVLMDLEEKLGLGRGPIRDALMRLDKSGLVQNIPYKGAIVTLPPSFREMEHIYSLRVEVEGALAVEALRQASAEDIAKLEAVAEAMSASDPDEPYFFHKDREFHSALYGISQMHHLQAIVVHLLDYVEAFLNLRHYTRDDKELFIRQHAILIQAIKDRDEATLRMTLEENILVGLELVRKEMKRFQHAEK